VPIAAHLLGSPLLIRDGVVYPAPRGRKAWALFAYLALSDRPPTRQQLVDLLFPDAEDPAGALRWNLSELRRLLGGPETIGSGNVVQLRLPEGSTIDVHVLMGGTWREAVELPGLGRELLEGMDVEASVGFTAWLLGERRRLLALSGAVLREGAMRALAAGNPRAAVELATRLVAAEPLDEDAHVLLVRAFAGTGDAAAVEQQLAASIDLFHRELGVEPGPELAEAARIEQPGRSPGPGGRVAVKALLESGEAAVGAGAIRAGVDGLREAVVAAREAGEPELEAAALVALGTALVHSARGKDEEGAAALHRAIEAAEAAGRPELAAAALRELGYVEVLRGDHVRARTLLRDAADRAGDDGLERARILAVGGASDSDVGAHDRARAALEEAIRLGDSAGQAARQLAWATAVLGRTHLLCGDLDGAEEALERAREQTKAERWTTFLAYPESLAAEVWVRRGDLDRASESFEHAFALGCQVDDACWEAYGVRGLGLLHAARGDLGAAIEVLEDALTRCMRQRDTHVWLRAYVLDALCAVAVAASHPMAGRWVTDLASLAGRTGMREMSVRAYLCRRDLGDRDAVDAARVLSAGVENPHLLGLVDEDGPALLDDLLGKVPLP
jgi:DNA-binding SARP family transcriptional activator